jgi:hypothetical protein
LSVACPSPLGQQFLALAESEHPDDYASACRLACDIEGPSATPEEAVRRRLRVYGRYDTPIPGIGTKVADLNRLWAKFAELFVDAFRNRLEGRIRGTPERMPIPPDLVRPEALRFDPDEIELDQARLSFVDVRIAPAPQSLDRSAEPPGPKPGRTPAADRAWAAAENILNSSERPRKVRGRLTRLAKLVRARLADAGANYEQNTIEKMIRPGLRDWERKNPDK